MLLNAFATICCIADCGREGKELSEALLGFAVRCSEAIEQSLQEAKYELAVTLGLELLKKVPNFTLAFYKVALGLMAWKGMDGIAL